MLQARLPFCVALLATGCGAQVTFVDDDGQSGGAPSTSNATGGVVTSGPSGPSGGDGGSTSGTGGSTACPTADECQTCPDGFCNQACEADSCYLDCYESCPQACGTDCTIECYASCDQGCEGDGASCKPGVLRALLPGL
jgi:hypothetical protein